MGVRLTVGVLAVGVAAAIAIGVAVSASRSDSPWCDDGEGVCPDEVLYNDQIYVVTCTNHIVGFEQVGLKIPAQLRDQQLQVRYHSGGVETDRRAWGVHGVDPAELIVLDEKTDPANCEGNTAIAFAHGGNVSPTEAAAILEYLSAASAASTTTTSINS